ncbi:uncharacterized protein LOC126554908 [Aphis gossypii]|uniref:uncharacterized protein LOC126554908 n=1 Tax=Aphis gossypii TaxID=80765 RepID=UPI0021595009|nr:uncharacterized protein LOC126554908 [Aphis gossypii]
MNLNINTSMIQEIQNIEPSEIPKHFNDIILKNFCNHKIIYTDGSKSNVKTGLAIITDEETFKFSSLEINSIFTIEALAILKAIELTEQNWKNTKSFLIASDSLSSILAIQNQGTSNEIIKNIQERASSLAPRSVTFMWIPAHKNIPGNENADIAAKEAASTNINIPKLDLSSFKDTARNSLINSKKIHQRLWDQELNNKLHQIKPFLSPNPNPPSSTRRQQERNVRNIGRGPTQNWSLDGGPRDPNETQCKRDGATMHHICCAVNRRKRTITQQIGSGRRAGRRGITISRGGRER